MHVSVVTNKSPLVVYNVSSCQFEPIHTKRNPEQLMFVKTACRIIHVSVKQSSSRYRLQSKICFRIYVQTDNSPLERRNIQIVKRKRIVQS